MGAYCVFCVNAGQRRLCGIEIIDYRFDRLRHALAVLFYGARHRAVRYFRLGGVRCVYAENRYRHAARAFVIARALQCGYCAQRHFIVVCNHKFHHIAVCRAVACQNGAHIVGCRGGGPVSVLVNKVFVRVCGIVKFNSRLSCRFQLDDGLEDVLVPPLSIQPLVENSIKYGLEEFPDTCSIIISAARGPEDILVVEVRNNGSFFEEGLLEKLQKSKEQASGTGIGLLNIHQRIQLLFGAEYGLTLYNQDGFAVASIRIPITCQGGLAYAETDHRR